MQRHSSQAKIKARQPSQARLGRPEHRGAPPWPTTGAGRFAPPASTIGPEIRTSGCTARPACIRATPPARLMTSSW